MAIQLMFQSGIVLEPGQVVRAVIVEAVEVQDPSGTFLKAVVEVGLYDEASGKLIQVLSRGPIDGIDKAGATVDDIKLIIDPFVKDYFPSPVEAVPEIIRTDLIGQVVKDSSTKTTSGATAPKLK